MGGAPGANPIHRPIEEEYARLARQIPGFGGYFYDESGNLTAYVTDLRHAGTAKAVLERVLRERRAGFGPKQVANPEIRLRQAQYDFRQLGTWRDLMNPIVLAIPGVVFTDVDEAHNRLRIGAKDETALGRVRGELIRLGIPLEAAILEQSAGYRYTSHDLDGDVRPIPGGYRIEDEYGGGCTLGFNARQTSGFETIEYFVTNSHCTIITGGEENTGFFQPVVTALTQIGREFKDPRGWDNSSDSRCPEGRRCRYSDAALIKYDSQDYNFGFGYIARTVGEGSSTAGTIVVDHERSFRIVDGPSYARHGDIVHKIGQSSGWTYGDVLETCRDINAIEDPVTYFCQNVATGEAIEADSGAPVFLRSGTNDAVLVGIHWAYDYYYRQRAFSALSNIRWDLGSLTVF